MKSYVPTLDGMRALAAIAVIAFHVRLPGFTGGYLGVDVFFVLSGYLTASIFLNAADNHTTKGICRFLINRMRRIWPLLATVSGITTIALLLSDQKSALTYELAPAVLFFSNLTSSADGYPVWLSHTWTLATEMQFYALLALIFWMGSKLRNKLIMVVLAACFIGVFWFRTVSIASNADWFSVYYHPFSHSSGLFLGAILAVSGWRPARAPEVWAAGSAALICAAFAFAVFGDTQSFAFWVVITEVATVTLTASLLVVKRGVILAALGNPYMVTLGIWSYGIYLWHYPIVRIARTHLTELSAFCVTFGASVILASITHKLVEKVFHTRLQSTRIKPPKDMTLVPSRQ